MHAEHGISMLVRDTCILPEEAENLIMRLAYGQCGKLYHVYLKSNELDESFLLGRLYLGRQHRQVLLHFVYIVKRQRTL